MITPPKKLRKHDRAAALILVLASLIFLSALTIAFLLSMRAKVTLSKSGSDASEVKMLAETAVNIAISQVRDATKKSGTNNLAWASQPGMIRLYNNAGAAAGYYKLYSADNMVATNGAFDPFAAADAVPAGWAANPSVFTDLNAPANGVFPILNTTAATALGVQGFTVPAAPGATAGQLAPMPVRWLYVLEDGTLHPPAPSSSGTRAVIPSATAQNPIVGRIAFWADDETTKVNINTASDGTFWSTPRFNTTGERQFANSQPARGEYQRYPGHPATVSLRAVFPSLTSNETFSMAPRLSSGGSMGGTVPVQTVATWIDTDKDRLYASVDEFLLKNPLATSANRTTQDGFDRAKMEGGRFFLTASSRAPELNLYGLPRIVSWPIHAMNDNNFRTINDRLIAFCSTLGAPPTTYPFYFTRQESLLPQFDISLPRNNILLNYLDRLTGQPIPGFGGTFQGKYTQPETRQILTEIFDYIRCTNLVDKRTPPGPVVGSSGPSFPHTFGISSFGGFPKGSQDNSRSQSLGTAVPAQHPTWNTWGFGGRFLQVRAAHLQFVGLGNTATPISPTQVGTRVGAAASIPLPADTTAVQAYFYLSTLNPGEGIEFWSPGHWIEIEGLDQFGVKLRPSDASFTPLGFPGNGTMTIMGNMLGGGGIQGARVTGLEPFGFTFVAGGNPLKTLTSTPPADYRKHFPFFSVILPVDSTSPTMAFQGGTITVRIYAEKPWVSGAAPETNKGALIKEFSLNFPDDTFPTPRLATNRLVGSGTNTLPERWIEANGRFFENTNDVLRTIPLDEGDIRLLAGPNTSTSFFKAQTDYSSNTTMVLPAADTGRGNLTRNGRLITGATYGASRPFVPDHINGAFTSTGAPGDWDNGTGIVGDGPFINAPDPGSIVPAGPAAPAYFDNSNTTASTSSTFFSPNRQMPGPGMFGSLSTGVQRRLPWQTLLFRPGPPNHPGALTPPDHLLLDLFWMPVVEPYAISEPFSTAGKINMNQQIVPFTYINRTTGLQAALAAEQVARVARGQASTYKSGGVLTNVRLPLNLSETNGTLRQFKERFDSGQIFRSATEICDIYLVPAGKTWTSNGAAQTDWYGDDFAMVGDNTRERPYAHLYNKLTTKSNVFTVHYHAQVLQKPKARLDAEPTIFDAAAGDKVLAGQRGSTTFERYLDPADPRIVATDPASAAATSLEEFYRARIVHTTIFSP